MPRIRQTCTRCSMRRQKCDRKHPCTRCIKDNVASSCCFEWIEGYDPKVHRVYPKAAISNQRACTKISGSSQVSHSHPRSEHQSQIQHSPSLRSTSPDLAESSRPAAISTALLSLLTAHNTAAVGRELYLSTDDELSRSEREESPIETAAILVPPHAQIFKSVDYHEVHLLGLHGCMHGPTFRSQLEKVLEGQEGLPSTGHDLFLALLFAVMTASITCASMSTAQKWGINKARKLEIGRLWFDASIAYLDRGDYSSVHHIYSLQAIIILNLSAHPLGFSGRQFILFGAATKIAQNLGIHRLEFDPEVDDAAARHLSVSQVRKERVVEVEIKRRVWTYLCAQDWLCIPSSEMYLINRRHCTTLRPLPLFDEFTSVSGSNTMSTASLNLMYKIGTILVDLHDTHVESSDILANYEQVLKYDSRLRALGTSHLQDGFQDVPAHLQPRVEREMWATKSSIGHKIIVLHRQYLGRSFTDTRFTFTRWACVTAAKSILQAFEIISRDTARPQFWAEQAHLVGAGITLCLDFAHRGPQEPEALHHMKLVEQCITILKIYNDSLVAKRGVELLRTLSIEARSKTKAQLSNDSIQYGKNKDVLRWSPQQRTTGNITTEVDTSMADVAALQPIQELGPQEELFSLPGNDAYWSELLMDFFPVQSGVDNQSLLENSLS